MALTVRVTTPSATKVYTAMVDPTDTVETLKATLEPDVGIPLVLQILKLNGNELNNGHTLSSCGVGADDMLVVSRGISELNATWIINNDADLSRITWHDIRTTVHPKAIHKILKTNKELSDPLKDGDVKMWEAVQHEDESKLRMILMMKAMEGASDMLVRADVEGRLAANPMDSEAQKMLEELIRKDNVRENKDLALEHMPEAFGNVSMLYIDSEVNNVPIKAFVDSGAQMTIMSKSCAERCNIMRLVDTTCESVAVGVGTSKIIGRVHMAQLKIGAMFFPCSFTVLEQDGVDFLLGLDMLKRYQGCIDLHSYTLRLQGPGGLLEVPFLGEGDIPNDFHKRPAARSPTAAGGGGGGAGDSSGIASGTPAAGGSVPEESVQQLMQMGFSRDHVLSVLQACNNDVNAAAEVLVGML